MSIERRIDELQNKHRQLDLRIAKEQKHIAADGLMINALKRQKLKLKEELQLLRAS